VRLVLGDRSHDLSTRTLVMGIVNRTPDSFYDRGATYALDPLLDRAATFPAVHARVRLSIFNTSLGMDQFSDATAAPHSFLLDLLCSCSSILSTSLLLYNRSRARHSQRAYRSLKITRVIYTPTSAALTALSMSLNSFLDFTQRTA